MVLLILPVLMLQQPIRVACVGDSITFGYGLPESIRAAKSYPGDLGTRLGGGYLVKNFGHNGSTVMNLDWLPPIAKTEEYQQALAFNPNIVIIMGGTNDGMPRNWEHVSQFSTDLKKITHSFLNLSTHPKVMIMVPPRLLPKSEHGMADDNYCNNVNQALPQLLREFVRSNSLQLIDSRVVITTRDCYTPDGIHLTEKGCIKLANQVAFVLLKKQTIHT